MKVEEEVKVEDVKEIQNSVGAMRAVFAGEEHDHAEFEAELSVTPHSHSYL